MEKLINSCPLNKKENYCPFNSIRKENNSYKFDWLNKLTEDETEKLNQFHEQCYCFNKAYNKIKLAQCFK
jgi:hypothetical protein